MNILRNRLGQVVTIDEDREVALRYLKHGCPDGEYSIEGPGIDMTFFRIDGMVYPSGGTIDGQGMPPRSAAECLETFGRGSEGAAHGDEAVPCMGCGRPVSPGQRTPDPADGANLSKHCAQRRIEAGERSVEGLMAQRKAAFVRWSFAKGYLSYRGEDVSLIAGPGQDQIGYRRRLYVGISGLTQVLRQIDELYEDDPETRVTVERAWEEWLGSEECRWVHEHGLPG